MARGFQLQPFFAGKKGKVGLFEKKKVKKKKVKRTATLVRARMNLHQRAAYLNHRGRENSPRKIRVGHHPRPNPHNGKKEKEKIKEPVLEPRQWMRKDAGEEGGKRRKK